MHRAALSLLVALAMGAAAAFAQEESIVVASTTSTQDSRLFRHILPRVQGKDRH